MGENYNFINHFSSISSQNGFNHILGGHSHRLQRRQLRLEVLVYSFPELSYLLRFSGRFSVRKKL
jgi:hypothetical protein